MPVLKTFELFWSPVNALILFLSSARYISLISLEVLELTSNAETSKAESFSKSFKSALTFVNPLIF